MPSRRTRRLKDLSMYLLCIRKRTYLLLIPRSLLLTSRNTAKRYEARAWRRTLTRWKAAGSGEEEPEPDRTRLILKERVQRGR